MDERVKSTYEKIYAELFRLILVGCSVSSIVKIALLSRNALDCIPEYTIIIGSPIYLFIRSWMLGVTPTTAPTDTFKRNLLISLFYALTFSTFVFFVILRSHGKRVEWANLIAFALLFIRGFLVAQLGSRLWWKRQQKKLEGRYLDD